MTKNPVLLFSLLVLDDEDTTITACSIVTVTVHLTRKNFEDHFLGGEVEEEKDRGDRKYRGKGYNKRVCYLYIYMCMHVSVCLDTVLDLSFLLVAFFNIENMNE